MSSPFGTYCGWSTSWSIGPNLRCISVPVLGYDDSTILFEEWIENERGVRYLPPFMHRKFPEGIRDFPYEPASRPEKKEDK
jgi:hypothetical protein